MQKLLWVQLHRSVCVSTLSFWSHYKLYYSTSPFFEVSIAYEVNISWLQNIQARTSDVLCVIHLFVLHSQYFYIILHWQYHRIVRRNHHCSAVFWCLSYNQINRDCRAYCSTQHICNQHAKWFKQGDGLICTSAISTPTKTRLK